ncbi:MAG: Flp pilus assembly protein CpaB [Rhodospirillales bacterium]|jgi:pilus assembly protein CpaB|nr:Flp pilus assembly protein CpaB [Rhodospirillales bacterium]MBT5113394.1 Flp pilus assembly protein CpaB [Rhodospirillales bacterium]MBT5672220.1 Flp pilus assembly protein CpaB [Rhodospirillales bacterium]MBT6187173.1 Flp pilus assembly protein CpaB [Rhodospirillales bacterium]MBT6742975.1 Flp pilus assembly protein CpaB [Rhodospirillales bacterium]
MNLRTLMMIGTALVAAVMTALFARGWLNSERAAMASNGKPAHYILVAKKNIPAGKFIKRENMRWQGWPKGSLSPAYVVKGKGKMSDFDGAVVRRGLAGGQPLSKAVVVRPGEQGFLSAVLTPGKRAVSIRVNAITGISGFVFPGDRVDLILTHVVRGGTKGASRLVSETALQDIRVIAVDQNTNDQKSKTKATIAKTVTFEVTPKQVEKVSIVTRLGQISLSLRSLASESKESDSTEQQIVMHKKNRAGLTLDTEVSRVLGRSNSRGGGMQVVRGSKVQEQRY